jgi:hypothetical protein
VSENDKEYRSRLRGAAGQPTRGMGSAYPQNQAVVGAADPVEAARLAKLSPEEAEAEVERRERLERDLDAMREDLLISILEGSWKPEGNPADTSGSGWKTFLEGCSAGTVQNWHEKMNKVLDAAVDEQDAEALKESIQSIGMVDPDDPLYDPLTDKARKKAIEKGLKPLEFEEMVWKGHCSQEIHLREGFRITLRTLSTQHGLWLEWYMGQQQETSYQHTRHMFSLIQVAATLDKVNDKASPGDLTKFTKQEQRDEFITALEERLEALGRLPAALSDDLIIQYVWFTGRVRKLLSGDLMRKVGNS